MTIEHEWIVLDTNVWIFGLRHQSEQPACADLLRFLHRLFIKIPRQIVLELYANLSFCYVMPAYGPCTCSFGKQVPV